MPGRVLALNPAEAPPRRLALVDPLRGLQGAVRTQIRVLIADAHTLVRAGFRTLLEAGDHITVVGEAGSGVETIALARRIRPDIVLLDGTLPDLDAVEAVRRIASLRGVRVMVLTSVDGDDKAVAALRAGASGFLAKDTEPDELLQAVRQVAGGDPVLSPALTRRLISELLAQPDPGQPSPARLDELTARERELMALAARGLSNGAIAERLTVSPATAKTHISRAMAKLGVHDRAQLVALAYQSGLVDPRSAAVEGEGQPSASAFPAPSRTS